MSDDAVSNAKEKRVIGKPFVPGQVANPKGRPKGSRNVLGEDFIKALHDDFKVHGAAVIETVRVEKPEAYLKTIASILPKQLEIKESAFADLEDDELAALVAAARAALGMADDDSPRVLQ